MNSSHTNKTIFLIPFRVLLITISDDHPSHVYMGLLCHGPVYLEKLSITAPPPYKFPNTTGLGKGLTGLKAPRASNPGSLKIDYVPSPSQGAIHPMSLDSLGRSVHGLAYLAHVSNGTTPTPLKFSQHHTLEEETQNLALSRYVLPNSDRYTYSRESSSPIRTLLFVFVLFGSCVLVHQDRTRLHY